MAFACSVAINSSQAQMYRHHIMWRDVQGLSTVQEQQKMHFGISCNFRWRGYRKRQRAILSEVSGEASEEEGTYSTKEKDGKKGDQGGGDPKVQTASFASNPFMAGKISSRIAARSVDTGTNGKSKATTMAPSTTTIPTSPFSSNIPSLPQRAPPQGDADKRKGAKPSVFLESRAGGFKELGPRNLMNTLKQPEGKSTRFGQPIVPTNLFDEPKRPAKEEKFEFSLNAGQLVVIGSFLTIISIMLGTAFLVWKVGGIHFNEY